MKKNELTFNMEMLCFQTDVCQNPNWFG